MKTSIKLFLTDALIILHTVFRAFSADMGWTTDWPHIELLWNLLTVVFGTMGIILLIVSFACYMEGE